MENKKRLIDVTDWDSFYSDMGDSRNIMDDYDRGYMDALDNVDDWMDAQPTVDAVEVVHGYSVGDVCFYGYFGSNNKSLALVEIVKISNDERGVAELKFLKVFVDDTGNGLFDYLLRSGKTMHGSFEYLKNITPTAAKERKM